MQDNDEWTTRGDTVVTGSDIYMLVAVVMMTGSRGLGFRV